MYLLSSLNILCQMFFFQWIFTHRMSVWHNTPSKDFLNPQLEKKSFKTASVNSDNNKTKYFQPFRSSTTWSTSRTCDMRTRKRRLATTLTLRSTTLSRRRWTAFFCPQRLNRFVVAYHNPRQININSKLDIGFVQLGNIC